MDKLNNDLIYKQDNKDIINNNEYIIFTLFVDTKNIKKIFGNG